MSHAATEPFAAAPPARRSQHGGAAGHALRWALVAAWCLTAGAVATGLAHGPVTAGAAFLSFLALGASALALNRQRAEFLRQCGARTKAEQLAREGQAGRAKAEARLRDCEYRLRWLSEAMKGYAVLTLDPEGRVLSWDKAAEALFGYPEREVLGRPFCCLCPEEEVANGKAELDLKRALLAGGHEERRWCVRQGGWKFWARVVLTPMREDGGHLRGLLCLIRDISEHRQAQDALRCSRTLYRNLTETARDVVITFARDGTITSLNLAFDKTTGWARGDWVGQPLPALAHPEELARMRDLLQCIAAGETTPVVELRLRLASGQYLAAEWMTTPQMQDGEVVGGLALIRDLTDRKKAEECLRVTEEKLRQAVKMEAVGRLAGGIAHDFNNLLTVILGTAELVLLSCQDEQLRGWAAEIAKAGERAATLTRQLLAFSRKSVMQRRVLELSALVGDLEKMLRRVIGEDIDFRTSLSAGPLNVIADPSQLEQVIVNLVVNARDAMPGGGALTIETSTALLGPDKRVAEAGAGRPYALLAVRDTGVGMDEHVQSHLFEPFFTTKEQGKGTGLGLAMVYGIVEQSDGHIEVLSSPGQGTTFHIYFPLTAEGCQPAEHQERQPQRPQRGTETILLAEDEPGVRALASNVLRLNGYQVLECADGAEALALCESLQGPLDLLVTDVVMPCLGGVDLARHVTRLRPRSKVLFMSGYPDRDFLPGVGSEGPVRYIQKPFSVQDFTSRVRELLDGAGQGPARA
jgi:PAS domain S-box-containing protein